MNIIVSWLIHKAFVTDGDSKKKKKSRWGGSENDKTFIPGMPTILPATLDPHQQEAYLGNYKCILMHVKSRKILETM